MKLEYSLTPYTKIDSKWIRDLNIGLDTIKLLEENVGRTLFDINHSKIFFDPPPRVMEIKTNKQTKKKSRDFPHGPVVKNLPSRGFPGGAVVENLPASAGDTGSSPGLGRSHMPQSN